MGLKRRLSVVTIRGENVSIELRPLRLKRELKEILKFVMQRFLFVGVYISEDASILQTSNINPRKCRLGVLVLRNWRIWYLVEPVFSCIVDE